MCYTYLLRLTVSHDFCNSTLKSLKSNLNLYSIDPPIRQFDPQSYRFRSHKETMRSTLTSFRNIIFLIGCAILSLRNGGEVEAQGIQIIQLSFTSAIGAVGGINYITVDLSYNMYLIDYNANRIVKFSPNGTQTAVFTMYPTVSYPLQLYGVAVDSSYNVYVVSGYNNRVVKFAPNGIQTANFTTARPALSELSGVAVDRSDNVYVIDSNNNRIVKFSPNGTQIGNFTTKNLIRQPFGVAVDPSYNMYGLEFTNNNPVVKISFNGNQSATFTINTPFNVPQGIAVDSSYNVYVADIGNNYNIEGGIVKFGPDGTLLALLTTANPILYPQGVAVDTNNNVYVADGNNRIVIFYFQSCPLGYYCPGLNSTATWCPSGLYCPPQYLFSNETVNCTAKYYCPAGTSTPIICPTGSYCPYMSGAPITCPASYYCPYPANITIPCPPGSYCPPATSTPIICPSGSYCPYMSGAPITCPSSYYCTPPASTFTPCPSGSYCPLSAAAPVLCPLGFYCPYLSSAPTPCPPSTFCVTLGTPLPLLCPQNINCTVDSSGLVSSSLQLWENSLANQIPPTASFPFCYSISDTSYGGSSTLVQGILSTTQLTSYDFSSNLFNMNLTGITAQRTYLSSNGTINQTVSVNGISTLVIGSIAPDNLAVIPNVIPVSPVPSSNGLEYSSPQSMYPDLTQQIQVYASTPTSYRERLRATLNPLLQPVIPYQSAFMFTYEVVYPSASVQPPKCPILVAQAYYFCYNFSSPSSSYGSYNITAYGLVLGFSNLSSMAISDATGVHLFTQTININQTFVDYTTIVGIQRTLPPTINAPYAEQYLSLNMTVPVDNIGLAFTLNSSTTYPNGDSYSAVRIGSSNGLLYETYRSDQALSFGPSSTSLQKFQVYQYSHYINQGQLFPCGVLTAQSPPRSIGGVPPFNPADLRIGQNTLTLATGSGTLPLSNNVYFQFIVINSSTQVKGLGVRLNDGSQNTNLSMALYNASSLLTQSTPLSIIGETISLRVPPQPSDNIIVELPITSITVGPGSYAIAISGQSTAQTLAYICCRQSLSSLNPAESLQNRPSNTYIYGSTFNGSGLGTITTAQLQNLGLDNLQLPLWIISSGSMESSSTGGTSLVSPTSIPTSSFHSPPTETSIMPTSSSIVGSSGRSSPSIYAILSQCNITLSPTASNLTLVSFTISFNTNFSSSNASNILEVLLSNLIGNGSIQTCILESGGGQRRLLQLQSSGTVYLLLTNVSNTKTQQILALIQNGTVLQSLGAQLLAPPIVTPVSSIQSSSTGGVSSSTIVTSSKLGSLTVATSPTGSSSGSGPSSIAMVSSVILGSSTSVHFGQSSSINTQTGSDRSDSSNGSSSTAAIAGGVVGGVLGVCILVFAIGLLLRYRNKRSHMPASSSNDNTLHAGPSQIELN
jgi:sugar lactone lactonase YvrE